MWTPGQAAYLTLVVAVFVFYPLLLAYGRWVTRDTPKVRKRRRAVPKPDLGEHLRMDG